MDTYYAAEVMNRAIDMVTKGLRDLRSTQLKPFYVRPDDIPNSYAVQAYDAAAQPMEDAELTPPTQEEFAAQLSNQGSQVFTDFMNSFGVLLEDTGTDVIETTEEDPLINLGPVTAFLDTMRKEGIAIDTEFVNQIAGVMGVPVPATTRKHIVLSAPAAYAELDPIVARRMARMREYVRAYFFA